MKKIIIWRGHHGKEIFDLIQSTLNSPDNLLILCPPRIEALEDYFSFLPDGMIEFRGELSDRSSLINQSNVNYPENPSFGLFSSGTTDAGAKLILYSKKNLESACDGIFSFFKDLNITNVFSYPQPYHIFGLSLGYIAAARFDWKLIYEDGSYSSAHHEKWVQAVETQGANLLTLGTPTHFLDAITYTTNNRISLKPSKASIAGGAKVEVSLWDKMQSELRITNPSVGYGCSEASPGVTHLTPGLRPEEDGDLGFVLPNGKLLETPEGFVYRGDNVCLAIIQNKTITFPAGQYLLSDTLALDSKGHYHFKKRSDLILNRGGEKFSLEEIESEIKRTFQINCVAIPVKDHRLGEELGIVFEGAQNLDKDIHYKVSDVFKRNFKIEYFLGVEAIPVNANAKFDRRKCSELMMERLG
ncbi:class I adenylate-forming enzyme family protein [Bacteriovorax sp. PP10]|uniref:Class I adenylate-forming enzyme family protein n=1 Tax=Bacteriovorax antarcticus TaxID=3088717 RepID=A0ABU5VVU9_9BACT|nr:class I adenylate-forming enzyme family protein [Bacteriovorax sp. PP10]MEA9357190.1 class I adenylate-forming enzyme family protein [Bacteriovorax sp. PP10]